MKKLQTRDIFAALRIVKAAEMREALKPVLQKVSAGKDSAEDIGIEAILTVLESVSGTKAENAFYAFLASPLEMSADEVATLPLNDFMACLKELAKENDLAGFFGQLSNLMSSN